MSDIATFTYSDNADHAVRVATLNNEPWFVLADLCEVLGIRGSAAVTQVKKRLDQSTLHSTKVANAAGFMRDTDMVSEPGMYEVVIRSDKAGAVAFRRWITHEVLPTIRKTGGYIEPTSRLAGITRRAAEGDVSARTELLALSLKTLQEADAKRIEAEAKTFQLEARIEKDAPYVLAAKEFFDDEGLLRLRDCARAFSIPERQFMGQVREWGWVDLIGTAAKSYARQRGYAENKVFYKRGGEHSIQGKLTRKGMECAAQKLTKAGFLH